MSRKRITVLLLIVFAMSLVPMNITSAQDPTAPVYMRYCDRTRDGDENLQGTLNDAEALLTALEDVLIELDNGRQAFIEVAAVAEESLATWDTTVRAECMFALNEDVIRLHNEILISSLYGQIPNPEQTAAHRQLADDLFFRIRTESQNAENAMSGPIPTATPTLDPSGPTPTASPTLAVRSGEELTQVLTDFLLNNGISVLIDAGVQVVPGNTLIVIRLEKFEDPDENFDLPNTYFTMDVLSRLVTNWPELEDITRIVIETYDGVERTLYVESTGEDFRAYYYGGTLTEAAFQAKLRIEEPAGATDG